MMHRRNFLSSALATGGVLAVVPSWAQALIRRGADLVINAGYVEQPWRITTEGKYESFGGNTIESIAPFWKQAIAK